MNVKEPAFAWIEKAIDDPGAILLWCDGTKARFDLLELINYAAGLEAELDLAASTGAL